MARNYKELQAKMNPPDVAENKQCVREELQRMALDELRNAKQLYPGGHGGTFGCPAEFDFEN
jgi:hypothetical protein